MRLELRTCRIRRAGRDPSQPLCSLFMYAFCLYYVLYFHKKKFYNKNHRILASEPIRRTDDHSVSCSRASQLCSFLSFHLYAHTSSGEGGIIKTNNKLSSFLCFERGTILIFEGGMDGRVDRVERGLRKMSSVTNTFLRISAIHPIYITSQ